MKLVIGLGNQGRRYANTRHNLGFMVLDRLAKNLDVTFQEERRQRAELARAQLGDETLLLAKPQTMMNLSGLAARALVDHYNTPTLDVLVICDDFNLPFGQARIRQGGSDGGHNGLGSIIGALDDDAFWRFRIGVHSLHRDKTSHQQFVTEPFSPEERRELTRVIERSAELIEQFLEKGELTHDTVRLT